MGSPSNVHDQFGKDSIGLGPSRPSSPKIKGDTGREEDIQPSLNCELRGKCQLPILTMDKKRNVNGPRL